MIGEKKSISVKVLWLSIRVLINIVLVLVLVEGFSNAYHFSFELFLDCPYKATSTDLMNITIEDGANIQQVAQMLDELEIVNGKYLFLVRAYIGKYDDKIKAGVYELGPGMSPDEICKSICGIQSEEEQ